MVTYEEYKKEQIKLAQAQANKKYKDKIKKSLKPITNYQIKKSNQKKINRIKKTFKVGYKPQLSKKLLSYANAFNSPQQSQGKRSSAGRPKMVYIHTSPLTGKPVPAPQYYKDVRLFRRLQAQRVEDMKEQQLRQYSQQGIAPNQIQNYQAQQNQIRQLQQIQRLQQLQQQRNMQQQMQYPQNVQNVNPQQLPNGMVIPMGNRIWRFQRGVVGEEGGLFGKQKKIYGAESSFWN